MNYRYIATKLGELLKYDTSVNAIARTAKALLPVAKESFPNDSITSVRAKEIYDWVLSLAKTEMDPTRRDELLISFCKAITPESHMPALRRLLDIAGTSPAVSQKGALEEFLSRHFHEQVVIRSKQLYLDGHYFHAVFEASKAYNKAVQAKSRIEKDGPSLMLHAWDPDTGSLKVTPCQSDTDKNVQHGIKFLSAGLMQAIRNPTSHEPALDWPIRKQECIELLGFISFLFRQLEAAVVFRA